MGPLKGQASPVFLPCLTPPAAALPKARTGSSLCCWSWCSPSPSPSSPSSSSSSSRPGDTGAKCSSSGARSTAETLAAKMEAAAAAASAAKGGWGASCCAAAERRSLRSLLRSWRRVRPGEAGWAPPGEALSKPAEGATGGVGGADTRAWGGCRALGGEEGGAAAAGAWAPAPEAGAWAPAPEERAQATTCQASHSPGPCVLQ